MGGFYGTSKDNRYHLKAVSYTHLDVYKRQTDMRDESNRLGVRIVMEVRSGVNPHILINQLYRFTPLQQSFGIIMLALVNGEPRVLNLKEMLYYYIEHQKDIIVRRTKFDLRKAEERAHIVEGLRIALSNLDEIIKLILSLIHI